MSTLTVAGMPAVALQAILRIHVPAADRATCVICGYADGHWPCETALIAQEALGIPRPSTRRTSHGYT